MGRKNENRITLKMIAQAAGVSIGTVDRAINDRPGIKQESKEYVLEVANTLGYRPNKFASALSRHNTIRLAIVFPSRTNKFYSDIEDGIDQATDELRDYGIEVDKIRYNQSDVEAVQACVDRIRHEQYDGVAMNAEGKMTRVHMDSISEAGIPIISFNTDLEGSKRLFFIGNSAQQSGKVAAELLNSFLHERGLVATIGNYYNAMPHQGRFAGFHEFIQEYKSDMQIIQCEECQSDTEIACNNLCAVITKKPKIKGIFCTGHTPTIGAIDALRKLDRADIKLIGYDVSQITAEAVSEGVCDALLYQDPFEQGYQATRLLARHILEDWTPSQKHLYIETQIIVRSNISSYIQRKENVFGRI